MKGIVLVPVLAAALVVLPESAMARGIPPAGAVYTLSNATEGNQVLVFRRFPDGTLRATNSVDTGGLGTGAGLGSQGAVVLSRDQSWLFTVNAGSDQVSVFKVLAGGLALVDVVPSGGKNPISLTVDRDLLYVLNAGGAVGSADSIAGFQVDTNGELKAIDGSQQRLSAESTGPAQLQFSADGRFLIATEKGTNLVDVFPVDSSGVARAGLVQESQGQTPFGFALGKRDQLFVSEAAGGAANASTVSSYVIAPDGSLQVRSAAVPTTETAACWVLVTPDGRFAYTTNTGSASITGFRISFDGRLQRLNRDGRTALTGRNNAPIDMAFSGDGRTLYSLNSGDGSISIFAVTEEGRLLPRHGVRHLPSGATGLAAR